MMIRPHNERLFALISQDLNWHADKRFWWYRDSKRQPDASVSTRIRSGAPRLEAAARWTVPLHHSLSHCPSVVRVLLTVSMIVSTCMISA